MVRTKVTPTLLILRGRRRMLPRMATNPGLQRTRETAGQYLALQRIHDGYPEDWSKYGLGDAAAHS